MSAPLQHIAKTAILEVFGQIDDPINREQLLQDYPLLNEPRASFVTLHKNGQLRGCIGSLVPHKKMIDDIMDNAKSAAFRDTRFPVLHFSEWQDISIEISLLSVPQMVNYQDSAELKTIIRPHIDGVILQLGNAQATFLPQVWESLPTFEQFFEHLCQKAGLDGNSLEQHPNIYTYQVEMIKN